MKVVFDFNLSAWIKGVEVEATSYEKALSKLHQMTFDELIETGFSKDFTIEDVDGSIAERTVKVKIYDIEYDVEEDDYTNPEEYIKVLNSLPATLTATIIVEYDDDLEDLVADEILYQTKQTANSFNFIIIEEN